ncbi:MAG: hypothetical protein A07HR67_02050 [uncultured archaeon A07HR67]|nr:MAG: hypothetical protein A07HR67_02050 [uncultured archaeon A07HR67]
MPTYNKTSPIRDRTSPSVDITEYNGTMMITGEII